MAALYVVPKSIPIALLDEIINDFYQRENCKDAFK